MDGIGNNRGQDNGRDTFQIFRPARGLFADGSAFMEGSDTGGKTANDALPKGTNLEIQLGAIGMTKEKWFDPLRHPGFSADMTPAEIVQKGRDAHEGYLTIGKQLLALSNVEQNTNPKASRKFKEASELAFYIHKQKGN